MRILVTGGLGFIGSHVVDDLVSEGHDVVVLDSLASAAHASIPDYVNRGADVRIAALDDELALHRVVQGVDAVCHQAARVGLGVDFDDVERYVHDNDAGTAALLRALWRTGFRGRLVVASSMVVYGEGRSRCLTHGVVRPRPRAELDLMESRFEPRCPECGMAVRWDTVPEDAPLDPRNVYAATKLHTEHLATAFGRETGASVAALRYHNVYGPRMPQGSPYAGVASIFRSALEAGGRPQVLEDGAQRRDFVHVRDVARANVLALNGDAEGPFNVASGEPHTILDMALALADAFGGTAGAPVVTGGYRLGDVRHVVADPARARAELGFVASVPFADGMIEFASAPLRAPAA